MSLIIIATLTQSAYRRTLQSDTQPFLDSVPTQSWTTAATGRGISSPSVVPDLSAWSSMPYASSSRMPLPASSSSSHTRYQPLTPMTSGVRPVPVPSRSQVNDYLVRHLSAPAGLDSGWRLDGLSFDVYALLVLVLQMGGSSEVRFRVFTAQSMSETGD